MSYTYHIFHNHITYHTLIHIFILIIFIYFGITSSISHYNWYIYVVSTMTWKKCN